MQNPLKEEVPLRIGIDGRVLQDPKPSGIPQYARNIITELLKLDKKNQYVIFYNSFRKIEKEIPKFDGRIEEKVFHYPNKILEWFWKIVPYPKIDRLINVDIFFSPHFINIPLSKKIKKIITIHDLSFLKSKKYFSFRKNLWHWQMSPASACKKFNKIIAVSESTKKDIVNLYHVDEKKVKVIYNSSSKIYPITNCDQEKNVLKKFNIQPQKYVLFLATLEPRKNIEGIIEAFAKIQKRNNDFKLVIAGKKGWLFQNIFKKSLKYGLQEKIIFTDFLSDDEKNILFKNCVLFIFPSFCEGFGIPLVEAREYNLPIITSITSSMPEIAKDGAILINPHNTAEIAISMEKLLRSQNIRNILKKKMRLLPKNSWEDSAGQTLEYILS